MTRTGTDAWQAVTAFVGITLGLVPLVQKLLTGSTGSLWQLLPGGGEGPPALTAAAVVTVVALLVVAGLERRKRR